MDSYHSCGKVMAGSTSSPPILSVFFDCFMSCSDIMCPEKYVRQKMGSGFSPGLGGVALALQSRFLLHLRGFSFGFWEENLTAVG